MKQNSVMIKVSVAFLLLTTILIAIEWFALSRMKRSNAQMQETISQRWSKVRLAAEALRYSNLNNRITMELFLLRDKAEIESRLHQRAENTESITGIVKTLAEKIESTHEAELIDKVQQMRVPYIASYQRGIHLLVDEHNPRAAQDNMIQDTLPRLRAYHDAWSEYVDFERAAMDRTAAENARSSAAIQRAMLSLIVLSVVLAASIGAFFTWSITRGVAVLEQLVATRTSELTKVNAALASSNAELEKFAYVASHDLQEPLRMVASYTQLLARRYKGKLDADADEFIGFAVDGASRMQQLILDLLSYSRLTTKGKPLELTDSQEACETAVANLRQSIADSGAVVEIGKLPRVWADKTQLTQLFQNLIGNAIKYRNEHKPEIHVYAEAEENRWVYAVRDNGIGIDPQYVERIFEMFQRLHTREEYPGTGIGLAICRKIAHRHGGRIWVESKPGLGSTFFFAIAERKGES
jgi:signal transduction histidine kinase